MIKAASAKLLQSSRQVSLLWTAQKIAADFPSSQQFAKAGFTRKQLEVIAARRPQTFDQLDAFKGMEQYIRTSTGLKQPKFMMLELLEILDLGAKGLQNRLTTFGQQFSLSKGDCSQLFAKCPSLFLGQRWDKHYEVYSSLKEYLGYSKTQAGKLSMRFPYLLGLDRSRLENNLNYLLKKGYSHQEIRALCQHLPQFLDNSRQNLKFLLEQSFQQHVQIQDSSLKALVLQSPRFLSLCPVKMLLPKFAILQQHNVPRKFIEAMVLRQPRVFLKSVSSFDVKLKYLHYKLKLDVVGEPAFPHILNYDYAKFIRPRCETLLQKKLKMPLMEVLRLSEGEFLKATGTSEADFQATRAELKGDFQLDYRQRWWTRWFKNLHPEIPY